MKEQHGTLNELHVSKSSLRSPFGPSHHETKHDEGEWDQKKKNQNLEDDFGSWWLWVPCVVYVREREREKQNHNHK